MTSYSRRPKGRRAKKVWDGARRVLGQPPQRMTVVKAHKGKSTQWIIELDDEVKLKLLGKQELVLSQLEEMV